MTPTPDPNTPAPTPPTQEPPAPGGENPGTPPAKETPSAPYMQFASKEEYEAHFGPAKTKARESLAKKHGFKTAEEMDAALTADKERRDAQKSELERANERIQALEGTATEAQTLKVERAIERAALKTGVDPAKLDDMLILMKAEGKVAPNAEGAIDQQATDAAVGAFLTNRPYFKGGGTTIAPGSNPADAGPKPPKENPWDPKHRNLTKQAEITRENPQLAARLRNAAKGK